MTGYLVYHPRRQCTVFNRTRVYHDPRGGNQDPYVWNDRFLHTYCHMPQMKPEVGQTILWVSGNKWPEFDGLYCDLVFIIDQKDFWTERDHMYLTDSTVDSACAYEEHYRWAHQHPYRRRRRFTLKANPLSFQPQDANGELLDIVPAFTESGLDLERLRRGLLAAVGSKPMRLGCEAERVARWLQNHASVTLHGWDILRMRLAAGGEIR
jgi:hypothetical protein